MQTSHPPDRPSIAADPAGVAAGLGSDPSQLGVAELRERLREAEETLAAIRSGEVDALIVGGPDGERVFTLQGAEQPYRLFLERMQQGAVTLGPDGGVLYCNSRFAALVRQPLERVIGSPFQQYLRPEHAERLGQLLSNPDGWAERFVLVAADGLAVPVHLAVNRLAVEGFDAACVVVTDLTEHDEKIELTAALREVREQQARLSHQNELLAEARRQADAANDAKDTFLAALSHELRTPLTPVLMTAAALEQDQTLPDVLRHDLAMMRRNIELEARLIDDLLDLTRIVRGKLELRAGQVDLHRLLAVATEICLPDARAKSLTVEQELAAISAVVEGDGVRLQQILWNLLRNAVKFTPHGGRIAVRTRTVGDVVEVAVVDTGIGIAPADLPKLFVPFEQTGRDITRQFGGLGLGLAISKRLAELHGGTIEAYSDGLGRGATFALKLPIVGTTSDPAGQPAASGTAPADRRLRLLLVEDHEDTRRTMSRLLALRHTVSSVATVADAVNAAGQGGFDLVISDLSLPDGTGLDLMRELRTRHGLRGICLSGFGTEEDVARSTAAGFDRHLTKPVDLKRLEQAIADLRVGR